MDRIVYVLGAGFSAPLGLPVMSNFLFKSKDMYLSDPEKYEHFDKVFEKIQEISVAKNYYKTNLFNIEEILSILEMSEFLDGLRLKDDFVRYIRDVIDFYTPRLGEIHRPGNWDDFVFGRGENNKLFGFFVANLFGIKFREHDDRQRGKRTFFADISRNRNKYDVISLNYDLVLEGYSDFINENYQVDRPLSFIKSQYKEGDDSPHLAKLHGCVEGGNIVPPTWAKGRDSGIVPAWKAAFSILEGASHLRFIGYSLPDADSYIKYLLKSAVLKSQNLKSIDVICIDSDGSTKKRYDDFFDFPFYRFKNCSVLDYLKGLLETMPSKVAQPFKEVDAALIETGHEKFMKS
ncbi:SIR2 family protein [Alloalcanivorax sp. C16-2]|uniref:SIR2 family protein n=1 Tax=Alloalcanivorax sp. C16-2 TaxID=3390052 RepID=UPI0039706273